MENKPSGVGELYSAIPDCHYEVQEFYNNMLMRIVDRTWSLDRAASSIMDAKNSKSSNNTPELWWRVLDSLTGEFSYITRNDED